MAMWRVVDEAPNYEVSDEGQVRNKKTGRILKPSKNVYGKDQVNLMDCGERLNRQVQGLVERAFG